MIFMSNTDLIEADKNAHRQKPISLAHRLEYFSLISLFSIFKIAGLDASSFIAGKFCRLTGPLIRPVSKRAENNLTHVYPDMPANEVKRITRDIWENLGRTAAEFAHIEKFFSTKDGKFHNTDRLKIDGIEVLEDIAANPRPVIFVSAHIANWEIMPALFQAIGIDYAYIYRPANNLLVNKVIEKIRLENMSPSAIKKGQKGVRSLIEALRNKQALAILVDQKLNDGIEAPLLGKPAMTAPLAARLSIKFNTPLIPVSISRGNGAQFHVKVLDPIAYSTTGDETKDILHVTTKINDFLGTMINEHKGQWLWFHRRWNTPK